MDQQCQTGFFSGTALVAKGDGILFTHVCGEASKRYHVPNKLDTKFNIGSMNKMFTATAIAQLVEKKLVSYDDPISKYVDESWLPKEMTDRITVHHLLTHTSGLGSYFNEEFMKGARDRFREIDDFKPLVRGEKLAFEPGSDYAYSNTGMLLAGVVIEKASGKSYFDYVRENIYEPAGMTSSDSYDIDSPVENLAIGYVPDPESKLGWRNNILMHVVKGGPAGGGYSTVGDLHRFARALQTGKLLSDASRDEMWTDHSGRGYGYGFTVSNTPMGLVVGHAGGFPGLAAHLGIFVDSGYIVAVAANHDGAASPIAAELGVIFELL